MQITDNSDLTAIDMYESDFIRLNILGRAYGLCCKETNIRRVVNVEVNRSMEKLATEAHAAKRWDQAAVLMRMCANDYQGQLMRDLVSSKEESDFRPAFLKSLRDICNQHLEWLVSYMGQHSLNEMQDKFYTEQLNDYSDLLVNIDKAVMDGALDLWPEIVWSLTELVQGTVIMTRDPKGWITYHSLEVDNYDNKLLVKFVEPIKPQLMSMSHDHRLDKLRVSEFKEIIASGNGKSENLIGQLVSSQLRHDCKVMLNELIERREGHVRWEAIHLIQDLVAKIDSNNGSGHFWNVKWDELFEDWVRINQLYDALPGVSQQSDKVSASQNMVFELVAFLGGKQPANKELGLSFCEAYFKRGENAIEIFAKRLTTHLHTVVKYVDITRFTEEDRGDLQLEFEMLLAQIEKFSVDENAGDPEKWLELWGDCTHFAEKCEACDFALRNDPVATITAARNKYLSQNADSLTDLPTSEIISLIHLLDGSDESYHSHADAENRARVLMSLKQHHLVLATRVHKNVRNRLKMVDFSKVVPPSKADQIKQLGREVLNESKMVMNVGEFIDVNHCVKLYRKYRDVMHFLSDVPNAEITVLSGFGKVVSWMFVGAALMATIWWIAGK